ncbi:MAG: leucine-rich repeat domain-containing protein [Spirochaetaceae bacterium]|jgi:hypothetical protein|nr:leucine-rich repeat domain-containing protein [Spirochaetaceae bacterium]
MRNVTKQLLLVCATLTALTALASCQAIADTSGLIQTPETIWISLTPTKAVEGKATLVLDFDKAIVGLDETLDEAGLAELFAFEYKEQTSSIKATGVKKTVVGIYTLSVKNVPDDDEGIVLVTIKKSGIAPATRLWALNGDVVPNTDLTASLIDFRFTRSKNATLPVEEIAGGIDHGLGTVVVVAPIGAPLSPLIPTLKTNPGNTFVPEAQTNFSGDVLYTISTAKSIAVKNQKTYTVSVMQQTEVSARIRYFGFTKQENSAAGLSDSVSGVIDEAAKTISVTVPLGTNVSKLKPNIVHSGAGIAPANLAEQDFTNPVSYSVTPLSGASIAYLVTLTAGAPPEPPEDVYDYTDPANNGWGELAAYIPAHQGGANSAANPARIKIINADPLDAQAMAAVNGKVDDAAAFVSLDFSAASNGFDDDTVTLEVMCATIKDSTRIKGIALPEGLTTIGAGAFYSCVSLTSITLPSSVNSFGISAFRECTSLSGITLPASLTTIGDAAFYGCTSLDAITLPEGLSEIGISAFMECTSLSGITLPESLTDIGRGAFQDCTSLDGIIWPSSVNIVSPSVFYGCTSLDDITLPVDLSEIGDSAFSGCTSLSGITLPPSMITIGNDAFRDCTGLGSITLPVGLSKIGGAAFYGCTSLSGITLPTSLDTIYDSTFYGCTSLGSITLPTSLEYIGSYAFNGCTSLDGITLPASLTTIGTYAFENCTSLTSITLPASLADQGWNMFKGCTALGSLTLSPGLSSISASSAFSGCTSLTSITLPASVTNIGERAFENCTALGSVTFQGTISASYFDAHEPGPFPGDLRAKYLANGIGTYTRTVPSGTTWTKQ